MASSATKDHPPTLLKAEYAAPANSKTFAYSLPSSSVASTAEKSAYFSVLRTAVVQLQDDVNAFLTAKMEEDKALASMVGVKVDEKKEEENYGEEAVEDV